MIGKVLLSVRTAGERLTWSTKDDLSSPGNGFC